MKDILRLATYAGEIMLKNGAETYRVEDTIKRICEKYDFEYIETFVTPTGIFICVNDHEGKNFVTNIKRIDERGTDLNKVAKVNDFSRKFVSNSISTKEGMSILKEIDNTPQYNVWMKILGAGLASGFFGIYYGNEYDDFFVIFIVAVLVYLATFVCSKMKVSVYMSCAVGSMVAAIFAKIFVFFHIGNNLDNIVISSIMILVPGVAITNAVRDLISKDLVSGVTRTFEAIIIGIFIAIGVGVVFNVWNRLLVGVI